MEKVLLHRLCISMMMRNFTVEFVRRLVFDSISKCAFQLLDRFQCESFAIHELKKKKTYFNALRFAKLS